jgi:hypothetical protein
LIGQTISHYCPRKPAAWASSTKVAGIDMNCTDDSGCNSPAVLWLRVVTLLFSPSSLFFGEHAPRLKDCWELLQSS